MTKYSQIPAGRIFKTGSGDFKKLDELYYEDLSTGFQSTWTPNFDESILTSSPATPSPDGVNTTDKFIVDAQNRMMTPNPNYSAPKSAGDKALDEIWGSGYIDCGPEDYDSIVEQCIHALKCKSAFIPPIDAQPVVLVSEAEETFASMSGSGAFGDAEAHEYDLMARIAINAAGAMTELAKLTETDDAIIFYPLIVDTLTRAYKAYGATPQEANQRAWDDMMDERKKLKKREAAIEKQLKKSAKSSAKKAPKPKKAAKKSTTKPTKKSAKTAKKRK